MRQRSRAGGQPAKAQRRKTGARKTRITPKAKRPRSSSAATKVARLARELKEARDRQRATAEVLSAISRSKFELQSILQSVVDTASQLCRADVSVIFRLDCGVYRFAAGYSLDPAYLEHERRTPISPGPGTVIGRAAMSREVVQIEDAWTDPLYEQKAAVKISGGRSMIGVPLMREGEPIGVIGLARTRVEPFKEREIELVTTFADQAVIAIENARLLNELRESLQRQTATADVLKAISRSTFDLQALLDTLVELAARLCEAETSFLFRRDGANFIWTAGYGHTPEYLEQWKDRAVPPSRGSAVGRAAAEGKIVHIADVFEDPEYTSWDSQKAGGYRSVLGVPLLREGIPIGVLGLTGSKPQSFSDKHIELVTTFADQAVIAIENVRLFEAEQQRTRELTESLEQQTATSEILRVISSSPGELEPVFEAILAKATRICSAMFGVLFASEGDGFRTVAIHGAPTGYTEARRREPVVRPDRNTAVGRVAATKQPVQIADIRVEPAYTSDPKRFSLLNHAGARTILSVPMLKDDELVGQIVIYRQEVQPFTDKQIELLTNFAAQAVIAIENTRLLNELRESLQQQTATADALKVISRSTFDLPRVLNTLLEFGSSFVRGR